MTKHLIINADDLGHPGGVLEATAALYEAGVVTSTTAMVNQPFWPQAAAFLRANPDLGAGVHLVMNQDCPILPAEQVPSLVDKKGRFRDGGALLRRYGRLRADELEAEWRAQIETFIADTGRQPDHLDLHCHYPYVFPSWFRVSLKLAQEYGHLAVRMPFDDALERKARALAASKGYPVWYVRWQGRRYRRMVAEYGLRRTNYVETSFSLDAPDERRTAEYLLSLLERLPEGSTELVSHPGTEGWRALDARALADPRVRQRIAELGIELITYGDLAPG